VKKILLVEDDKNLQLLRRKRKTITSEKKVLQISDSFGKVFMESVPGSEPLSHVPAWKR
jgi:hypothetical protein